MIVPELKRYQHSDENLLPMINIVFLLLIFFMITGAIVASDGVDLQPTTSSSGRNTTLQPWVIALGASGQLALHGEQITPQQLQARLQKSQGVTIQIKADRHAPSTHLLKLLHTVNKAGIEKVQLLGTQPQP